MQLGGYSPHLGEALVVRVLDGDAALEVRKPNWRAAGMLTPLGQQRLRNTDGLALRIRVLCCAGDDHLRVRCDVTLPLALGDAWAVLVGPFILARDVNVVP